MNKLIIAGNIGQDCQVKTLESGTTAIGFTVCVSKKVQGVDTPTWFQCTRWVGVGGSTKISEYLKKGTKVIVEGEISARTYNTANGEARVSLDVFVTNIELFGGAAQAQANAPAQQHQQTTPPAAQQTTPAPQQNDTYSDDLPF